MKNAIIVFLFFVNYSFSQSLILKNEVLVYSFVTTKGKKMVLARDKANKYLVYRFGTDAKVELEFPEKNKESWKKFTFSYYSQWGDESNAGKEYNAIKFKINNIQYVITDNSYAPYGDEDNEKGINIYDFKTKKTFFIGGIEKNALGGIGDFRHNGLLKIESKSDWEQ